MTSSLFVERARVIIEQEIRRMAAPVLTKKQSSAMVKAVCRGWDEGRVVVERVNSAHPCDAEDGYPCSICGKWGTEVK